MSGEGSTELLPEMAGMAQPTGPLENLNSEKVKMFVQAMVVEILRGEPEKPDRRIVSRKFVRGLCVGYWAQFWGKWRGGLFHTVYLDGREVAGWTLHTSLHHQVRASWPPPPPHWGGSHETGGRGTADWRPQTGGLLTREQLSCSTVPVVSPPNFPLERTDGGTFGGETTPSFPHLLPGLEAIARIRLLTSPVSNRRLSVF